MNRYEQQGFSHIIGLVVAVLVLGLIGLTGWRVYSANSNDAEASSSQLKGNGGEFHPINPARIMDSRAGVGTKKAILKAGETRTLTVRGKGGVDSKAVSAALNFTVVNPSKAGYLTAYPSGSKKPTASVVNFAKGQVIANHVYLGIGGDGKVKIYNGSKGNVHVVVDVDGYFVGPNGANGLRTRNVRNHRMFDTRKTGAIPAKKYKDFAIDTSKTGKDVEAIELNLTAVNPASAGYLTAYPAGTKLPGASSVNFAARQTIANAVTVKLKNNKIRVYNGSNKAMHVIGDVGRVFGGRRVHNGNTAGKFVSVTPFRLIDTRNNTGVRTGILTRNERATTKVTGKGGVPSGASLIAANVTATGANGASFISASHGGDTSILNYTKNSSVANGIFHSVVQNSGQINFVNGSHNGPTASTHLIVDVMGYVE